MKKNIFAAAALLPLMMVIAGCQSSDGQKASQAGAVKDAAEGTQAVNESDSANEKDPLKQNKSQVSDLNGDMKNAMEGVFGSASLKSYTPDFPTPGSKEYTFSLGRQTVAADADKVAAALAEYGFEKVHTGPNEDNTGFMAVMSGSDYYIQANYMNNDKEITLWLMPAEEAEELLNS